MRLLPIAVVGTAAVIGGVGLGLYTFLTSTPAPMGLDLPASAIALESPEGRALLASAHQADHPALSEHHVTQQTRAYCGVASAVMVLGAAGQPTDQDAYFTTQVEAVRPWWRTLTTGMTLPSLGEQLGAHGLTTDWHHADAGVEAFRQAVATNAKHADDWLVVNYDRATLGQVGGGHFSPISAYDAASDQVLILDTATYKYPPHWVSLESLFDAMHTEDSETGALRGWLVVRRSATDP